jgi:hypothetical protein
MLKRIPCSAGWAIALAVAMVVADGCSKSSSTGPSGGTGGVGGVVTVTGIVVGSNGQAVAGVPVVITGQPSTNTDAGGKFTLANVSTPYDISVVDAAHMAALVYKGLTRTDPSLLFLGSNPGVTRTGNVSGKISGGTFTPNQGANDLTVVAFASPETMNSGTTLAGGAFGPLALSWYGPSVTTGNLYAIQFTKDAGGLPVASGYKGYGVRSGIAVNDGSTLNNQFDTLQSVPTNQFTGTITVPAGQTLAAKALFVKLSQFAALQLISESNGNGNLSYYTPAIPGGTLLLGMEATGTGGSTTIYWKPALATSATGVPVTMVAPPGLSLPVAAATGIDTTVTFSWTAMPGAVHLVVFMGGSGKPSYYVLTAGTSATIPNMKQFGLGLPASSSYTWFVYGFGPTAGVDAAAGSVGFVSALAGVPISATGDIFAGQSTQRSFTTAP